MRTETRNNGFKGITVLVADEGKTLRRLSDGQIFGEEVSLGFTYYLGGVKLSEPLLELPEHYEEVDLAELERQEFLRAKNDRLAEIMTYDSSSAVNIFYYMGQPMWFDKATRVGLMNAIQIQKGAGLENTTLWYNDTPITVPVDMAIQMLSAIELYALECFNVTARHYAEVGSLEGKEAINDYDITEGYPEVLKFDI